MGDNHRVGHFALFVPQGDPDALSFKKSFNFALLFVPLRRRNLSDQPPVAHLLQIAGVQRLQSIDYLAVAFGGNEIRLRHNKQSSNQIRTSE